MNEYIALWKNGFNFNDRTTRRGFWMPILVNAIIEIALFLIAVVLTAMTNSQSFIVLLNGIIIVYAIFLIIPSLACVVRRLHDINKSGWWIFITLIPFVGGIILFVFYCLKSVDEGNRFGTNKV